MAKARKSAAGCEPNGAGEAPGKANGKIMSPPAGQNSNNLAERFHRLFAGLERAHGLCVLNGAAAPGQKRKGRHETIKGPFTEALADEHLQGTSSRGSIPIRDNRTVRWGAIDIDEYSGLDHVALEAQCRRLGLPLNVATTKSNGAHLFAFCSEDVPAELMQGKLMEWGELLGLCDPEYFPKQTVLVGPNDFGNFVNLPYFGGDQTDRYGIRNGQRQSLEEFVDAAEASALTLSALEAFQPLADPDDFLADGPPCLQTLAAQGFGEGGRNNGLFNLGVYLRKRFDGDWTGKLDEANQRYMDPPLGHREVGQVERSVSRKTYQYKCHDQPIVSVCNRALCLKRQYGVGEHNPDGTIKNQADRLLALLSEAECWHTPDKQAYATITQDGRSLHLPIDSKDFERQLVYRYERKYQRAPGAEGRRDVITVLDARALTVGQRHKVYVRVAEAEDAIWIDLGREDYKVVRIDRDGYAVVDTAPVRFYRPAGQQPSPLPESGGSLEELRPFLNLNGDADWYVLVPLLVAYLRAVGPYPVCDIEGEQGASKSSTARIIRLLIDPAVAGLRSMPRDERDLVIAATKAHLLAFDNLSGLPAWFSDALCRVSTGGGLGTRELYTNKDEVLFDLMRPVLVNGINELPTRADLRDRTVVLELPPIPEERRRDEAEYWSSFEAVYPRLLGALYELVSGVLRELPRVRLKTAPRMADFARICAAVERVMGWPAGTSVDAYASNRRDAVSRSIEHDVVAAAVLKLVESSSWAGTPAELLKILSFNVDQDVAYSREWPQSARMLSNALRRAATDLRSVGVLVTFARGHERRIFVEKVGQKPGPEYPREDEGAGLPRD
jgi:hypothetical protein